MDSPNFQRPYCPPIAGACKVEGPKRGEPCQETQFLLTPMAGGGYYPHPHSIPAKSRVRKHERPMFDRPRRATCSRKPGLPF